MKLNFDIKNKKGAVETDVEKLVEKGMEQHDKNWKDKFNTKHNAKKEMLEMKHKQKMEIEEKTQTKKNWFQKIEEERRKTRELELAEERRREEERKKSIKVRAIISVVLAIVGLIMMVTGIILTSASGNPDSEWGMLSVLGMFPWMVIAFLWIDFSDDKKKKKRK